MGQSSRWHPGRLLVGWALGVLTTIGLVTSMGGWYEHRQLSTAPGSGSPARRVAATDSACQVDRDSAINIGNYEVVPRQDDPCYLRRPRIRPWQWLDGIRELLGTLSGTSRASGSGLDSKRGADTTRRTPATERSAARSRIGSSPIL